MAKLNRPLFSLSALGALGKNLVIRGRGKARIAERKAHPHDARSFSQISWRTMYQKAVALWHLLDATEKQAWERQATPHHMTGFAYFISQALKPNPGIYLPLAGGVMQGEIDMASNRITGLPAPGAANDPSRQAELTAHAGQGTGVHKFNKSCHVTRDAAQSIANATWTVLAFNIERWDTDSIHDNVVNNTRLTCKTAGKYQITCLAYFDAHAAGSRLCQIRLNGATFIAHYSFPKREDNYACMFGGLLWKMAVNDYVEFMVYHNSGGALDILKVAEYTPEFMMARVP